MTTRQASDAADPIIERREQLIAPMAQGEKPKDAWRIGTEHEKLVYRRKDHAAPSYDEPGGIRDILLEMQAFGWKPVEEGGNVIALTGPDGAISLEPAGQLELSGAPLRSLHETCAETGRHLDQVKAIGERFGVGFLGLGMWPDKTRAELPVMPKGRYEIMLRHMPRVGTLGLGKPNGFLSYRSHIWSDTDPQRTGMLPFVFDEGFGYEAYVDYILDVPMYFVFRDGRYIDASGLSFRDFLDGKLSVLPGERPRQSDWWDHLSTAFPEVRLKSFLEMRGADGGPWNRICALPALWVGLLYDQGALDAAWDLVKDWTMEEREALRGTVPKLGLDAPIAGGRTLRDIAPEVLRIARAGLASRAMLGSGGDNETGFLETLDEIVASGKVPAQRLLDMFHGEWNGDISQVYQYSF